VHERRVVGLGREGIEDGGQRVVLDLDQVAGVLRDVAVLGDDRRDGLAVVAHLLRCDQVLDDRARPERGQRCRVSGDVGAGYDLDDAGKGLRLRGVDPDDARVRVRAPHDRGMGHARQVDVVDVAAFASQEARVLDPVQALSEPAAAARLLQRRLGRDARGGGELLDAHGRAATDWIASTICW
jgi:hypothetical protein